MMYHKHWYRQQTHNVYLCCVCSRERYSLIITPLLVHAQRRLLERINFYGGPSVPQPHHVKTQTTTGKEVEQPNQPHTRLEQNAVILNVLHLHCSMWVCI